MDLLIKLFNGLLTKLFDFLLWPFRGFDPLWALVVISLLTGLLMLWIFGRVSNQEVIRRVRERIRGNLLGIRLYRHDVRVLLKLQGNILGDTLRYMKQSVLPMLVVIVPVILILVQLNLHFAQRPLEPGDASVVTVKVRKSSDLEKTIVLHTPSVVNVETPGLRVPAASEIAWRIRSDQPGCYSLKVMADTDEVAKELCVGEKWRTVSSLRTAHLGQALFYPGEPPITSSTVVDSVEIKYRPMNLFLFGWRVHWLFVFFVFSILSAFGFRRVLGVEI